LKDLDSIEKEISKVAKGAQIGDKDQKKAFEVLTVYKNTCLPEISTYRPGYRRR